MLENTHVWNKGKDKLIWLCSSYTLQPNKWNLKIRFPSTTYVYNQKTKVQSLKLDNNMVSTFKFYNLHAKIFRKETNNTFEIVTVSEKDLIQTSKSEKQKI